jgi:putative oxidoreductase
MNEGPMRRDLATWIFGSTAPPATWLVRAIVGAVFVSEGVQKFLFPAELGVGRFVKIGIPSPEVMAPFVGVVETVGGLALVVGLGTRLVAIPLLISMLVAITSTKLVTFGKNGFWMTAHEARTDLLMICGLVFLLSVGAGPRSLDARIQKRRTRGREPAG